MPYTFISVDPTAPHRAVSPPRRKTKPRRGWARTGAVVKVERQAIRIQRVLSSLPAWRVRARAPPPACSASPPTTTTRTGCGGRCRSRRIPCVGIDKLVAAVLGRPPPAPIATSVRSADVIIVICRSGSRRRGRHGIKLGCRAILVCRAAATHPRRRAQGSAKGGPARGGVPLGGSNEPWRASMAATAVSSASGRRTPRTGVSHGGNATAKPNMRTFVLQRPREGLVVGAALVDARTLRLVVDIDDGHDAARPELPTTAGTRCAATATGRRAKRPASLPGVAARCPGGLGRHVGARHLGGHGGRGGGRRRGHGGGLCGIGRPSGSERPVGYGRRSRLGRSNWLCRRRGISGISRRNGIR